MTAYEYHNDDTQNYQYISLKEVIDRFVRRTLDDDSIIKNVRRYKLVDVAKEAIRELNKSTFNDVKVVEITVPENLSIPLPHDFVSFVRCSRLVYDEVTSSYRLKTINVTSDINISTGYLQNSEGELLFNQAGQVLYVNGLNGYNEPYKKYEFVKGGDARKYSKYGECIIDNARKQILFSSDLALKEVVVEYLSDGLQYDTFGEEQIRVHKNMETALKDLMYFYLVEYRQNVPQNEKQRALLRYKTTKHEAKINRCKFNLTEIARHARAAKS